MILLLLFWLGASIGSFLNVCIWRLPRGESVVHPPSHCPNCNTRLNGWDLFPLLSQLWLRGQCRYCGMRFSWRYFGVEMLTGLLFVLVGLQTGNLESAHFWAAWVGDPARLARDLTFMATLVVVFFVDYDTRRIQLESVFLMGLTGVAYDLWHVYQGGGSLTDGGILSGVLPAPLPGSLVAMAVASLLLALLRDLCSWIWRQEAMGFGDVILVAAIAANLGWNLTLVTCFFLAVMLGSVIGVGLQIPRAVRSYGWGKRRFLRYGGENRALKLARRAFQKALPFGPMLAMGAVAALLFGAQLNEAYLNLVNPPPAPGTPALGMMPPVPPPPGSGQSGGGGGLQPTPVPLFTVP